MRNKKTLLLSLIALVAACKGKEIPEGKFDGAAALAYAKTQVDFGPRIPGTTSAQRAGDWIVQQMRSAPTQ
jgi:hypothetical protein